MRQINFLLVFSITGLLLTACSPINSLQPFDQQQAELLLKNDSTIQPAEQKIEINLPQKETWQKTNMVKDKRNLMFIPANESEQHWTQSIRSEAISYSDEPKMTAKRMVLNEMKYASEHCKVNAVLTKQTTTFITYKLDLRNCDNQADQIQIGKAFNGSDGVYLIYYTAISGEAASSQLEEMSVAVKSAELRNERLTPSQQNQ